MRIVSDSVDIDPNNRAMERDMEARKEPSEDKASAELVILESLLCVLRERNILSRADIELLCKHVALRAASNDPDPLPACSVSKTRAKDVMTRVGAFIGLQYGGKHLRH